MSIPCHTPSPACPRPTVPVPTAQRSWAQPHAHLGIQLCGAVCKEPFASTHQVPTASRDRGSNPESIKVQWCHKTPEIGLNSWILNRKPLPAAPYPLGPHARPCNSLLSAAFPGAGSWKRCCCSASLHPQALIGSVTQVLASLALPAPMDTLPVALTMSARSVRPCCALSRGRISTRVTGLVSKPQPGAEVKQK